MNTFKVMPEGWNNKTTKIHRNNMKELLDNNQTGQAFVKKCDENYNLHVEFENGIKGIVPREEIEGINLQQDGLPKVNLCTGKVHKLIQFKIKNIENEDTLILSRKQVQNEAINWIKNDLEIGDKLVGIVKNIKPYGAFIEIGGGVVGIVHIEDLSVARIKTPYERLKIGQKINVVVKSIDKEYGRVILSHKETLGTWEENANKFTAGQKVKGIARETEKNKNGIFIELTPNLVGMAEYKEGIKYGQDVDIYIKKIDKEKKKVKLLII